MTLPGNNLNSAGQAAMAHTTSRAQRAGNAGPKKKSCAGNSALSSTFEPLPLAFPSVCLHASAPSPPPPLPPPLHTLPPSFTSTAFTSSPPPSSSFLHSTSTFLFSWISPLLDSARDHHQHHDATYTSTRFNARRPTSTKKNFTSAGRYSAIPASDPNSPSHEKESHLQPRHSEEESSNNNRGHKRVSFATPIDTASSLATTLAATAIIATTATRIATSRSMFTRQEPLDDDEPLLPLVSQPGMKDAAHLEDPNVSIGSNTSTGCTSSTSTVVASSSTSTPIKDSDGFGLDLGLDDVAVSPSPEAMEQNERRPSIALSISSAHSDEDDVPTPEALREAARDKRRLKLAIGLCTTFFCVELAGGIVTDSLALLSDSFHLLTDITSFCISLAAIYLSQRLPTATHTFGYHRAEVLGALFSIFLIWGLTCLLVIEAFDRIRHPLDIDGKTMSIVAGLGVFVNICLMFVLGGHHHHHHGEDDHHHHGHGHEEEGTHAHSHAAHHRRHHHHSHGRDVSCHEDEHDLEPLSKHNSQAESEGMLHHRDDDEEEEDDALRVGQRHMNLNITAATLHVLGDLLSSIGVLISSLLITFFPSWTILDPICTFIFSFLVILTTIGVFKRSVSILMERVPNHLSVEETREAIRAVPGVLEVKRIHLWSLTLGQTALTARVYLQPDIHDTAQAAKVIRATRRKLRQQYGIRQSTIQFETLQALGRSSSRQLQQQCLEDESSSSKSSLSSSHDHDHGHDHHHSHGHTHSRSHVHTHSHHHRGPSDGRAPERHDVDIIFSVGEDEDNDDTIRHST